jgi:hypothetical protein
MLFSGAWGNMIHGKKPEANNSRDTVSLNNDPSVIKSSSATIMYSYMYIAVSESVKVTD